MLVLHCLYKLVQHLLRSLYHSTHFWLTELLHVYVQVLDLAGCPQVTVPLLFTSASQALKLHKPKTTVLTSIRHWPEIPQFKSLGQLSLSQCLRINQNDLLSWLEMACPNLRVLHVSNCPQIQIELMSLTALPKLNHLDLSMPEELVELEGAVTKTKVRVLETTSSRLGYMKSICHTNLMGLSLRGRSEVTGQCSSFPSCPFSEST